MVINFKRKIRKPVRSLKRRILGRSFYDGRVRAYLTLKCNLNCDFCVNTHVKGSLKLHNYRLLAPDQWIRIFNTIKRDIVITGGEPFLYQKIGKIILGVNPELDITIYSNLMVPLKGDLSWLGRKRLSMYLSYHPVNGNDDVFIENLCRLKHYRVSFSLHAIDVMGREQLIKICSNRLGPISKKIIIDKDQRELFESSSKKFKKEVRCQRTNIIIAPDGTRYQCVSRMVRKVEPFENVLEESLTPVCRIVACKDYGNCAPCDGLGEINHQFISNGD